MAGLGILSISQTSHARTGHLSTLDIPFHALTRVRRLHWYEGYLRDSGSRLSMPWLVRVQLVSLC